MLPERREGTARTEAREEGARFHSHTGPAMFSEHALKKGLKTRHFGHKIYTFDSIDSTNNCARAVAGAGAVEGTTVLAELQTNGRGRLGRLWEANPGENLTFSIVLRPHVRPEELNLIPLYVGVAVAAAIEKATGLKTECKWPNDLLINGKKVCGILIESSVKETSVDYAVVGIGLNVNQREFPPPLIGAATSLALEAGHDIDRPALFRDILGSLEKHYEAITSNGYASILPLWLSRSSILNSPISLSDGAATVSGIVRGLSAEGGLILQTKDARRTFYAGDVTVLKT